MELKIGDSVTAIYKTGHYYGEITRELENHYTIKVLAVKKHPMQGDLHHPKEAEVPFFHERKALAYREQANVPKPMVKPFNESIPDYKESLAQALSALIESLEKEDTPFSQKSLSCLENLKREYFK
ncbi:kinase-associated protein B [Bacillus oleivorans]|uniref:Kinase-associated protein B n=1 Tax=Bacillus oleivorans TaxID=1448271 RepID=A0A285D6E5_9BACI|nr:kinase-associated lipoprotein B [Bacillus oleivorans]SNX75225.1 kinase-associated protein B [Bacillus oleivorans]